MYDSFDNTYQVSNISFHDLNQILPKKLGQLWSTSID